MRDVDYFVHLGFKAPGHVLDQFYEAFQEGFTALIDGHPYTDCPYGLPESLDWDAADLAREADPKRAGWLLGWWCTDSAETSNNRDTTRGFIIGGSQMAAFLWGAVWHLMESIQPPEGYLDSAEKTPPNYAKRQRFTVYRGGKS